MEKKNRVKQQSFYDERAAEQTSMQIMDSYESGLHDGEAGPLNSNLFEDEKKM
ncbi:hypothetical protein [Bacillus sp. SG-1]|uniref:hypothetical protein n=1 Tax=Bacillus sp. SG-1 TaxID=161544 RepID=UPI0001543FC1|nr:hypothetical protein [Bacillus sp. SG-1]EDL65358.1 hypothetical protein BSG1_10318 [Bacillus sp. SG-1]